MGTQSIYQVLGKGEKVVFTTRLSPWLQWRWAAAALALPLLGLAVGGVVQGTLGFALLVGAAVAGVALAGEGYRRWANTEFAITSKRLVCVTGRLLKQQVNDVPLNKVDNIQLEVFAGWSQHAFATLVLTGSGNTQGRFEGVPDPIRCRKAWIEAMDMAAAAAAAAKK